MQIDFKRKERNKNNIRDTKIKGRTDTLPKLSRLA